MTKDTSFKDFFYSEESPDRSALPGATSYELSVAFVAELGLPGLSSKKKSDEFAESVSKIAQSEPFIEELSTEIGVPGTDESEDAFVRRAKATMKELLRRRFRRG